MGRGARSTTNMISLNEPNDKKRRAGLRKRHAHKLDPTSIPPATIPERSKLTHTNTIFEHKVKSKLESKMKLERKKKKRRVVNRKDIYSPSNSFLSFFENTIIQ